MNSNNVIASSPSWLILAFLVIAILIGGALGYATVEIGKPVLLIAGAIALILAVVSIFNSEVGLLMLIVITYVRLSDILIRYHGLPSIAKPFIALLLVGIFLRWFLKRESPKGWIQSAILVGAYGLVVFASLFYAADFQRAQEAFSDYFKDGIITVIIVVLLQTGATFKRVIWALLAAGFFLGTIGVYQYLTRTFDNNYYGFGQAPLQHIVGEENSNRISGPIGDPNFFAQIMLVIVPLGLNRMVYEKKTVLKVLAGWIAIAALLTVIFTYSRGAFLALLLMAFVMFLYRPLKFTEVLVGILLITIVIRFVPNPYLERISTIQDIFSNQYGVRGEVSFRGRASEALAAWLMFADHPILGVGVQNYPIYYQYYSRQLGLDPRLEARSAHSLYLQIAAETGLLGIIVFGTILWLMFRNIRIAWRRLEQAGATDYAGMVFSFAIGVVGYMSASLFIHGAYPRYFWILAGVALAIPHVAENVILLRRDALTKKGGRIGRISGG